MGTRVAKLAEDGRVIEINERDADSILAENEVELSDADGQVVALFWRFDAEARAFVELPFRAMVLDADGVLREVQTLESSAELTPVHIDLRPLGGDCDREPGHYRWDAEGRQLVPLKRSERRPSSGAPDLERALADFWLKLGVDKLPASTRAWVEQYRTTQDARKKKGA